MKKRENDVDFKYNLSVYWSFLKKYKVLLVFLLFLVLITEASATVENYLFKIIVDQGNLFLNNELERGLFVNLLIIIAAVFLGIIVTKAISRFLRIHFINRLEGDLIADLKRKYFNHIVGLSHRFHSNHKTGSLISRIIRGGNAVESMTDIIIFNLAPLVFQFVIVVGSIFLFDFKSAIVVILTVLMFILYSIFIQNKQKPYGDITNQQEDLEKAYISDVMTNIDSIKHFGKESYIKSRFRDTSENVKNAAIRYWDFFKYLDMGHTIILGLGIFFLMYFPLKSFLDGDMSIGTVVFIYTVFGNLTGPLYWFVHAIRGYYRSMNDFNDLFQYGKIKNDIKDVVNAKELKIKQGSIEFKKVYFKYKTKEIFSDFNLKIQPNEKVALVGHSGSGKTTLIKLLYRLYDVNYGEILIDGENIKKFKQESLRSELSIVPQECILFDDTIYNNIIFSKPNATKKEVMKAMKFAQLDRVVANFPKKENTIVGERGVKLSGGEKQRVSIARAILADKKILVLDEATSALDSVTESEIQKALIYLMQDRTSIVIAHRLSTIMHADKIVVMKKGKIVQIGSHKDLIRIDGTYKELWTLQKGGYIK